MSVFLVQTGSFAVNIHTKTTTDPATAMSPAEWEARVDLAAVYRLVAPRKGEHFSARSRRRNPRHHWPCYALRRRANSTA